MRRIWIANEVRMLSYQYCDVGTDIHRDKRSVNMHGAHSRVISHLEHHEAVCGCVSDQVDWILCVCLEMGHTSSQDLEIHETPFAPIPTLVCMGGLQHKS